ncbi:hypothetical protein FTX61_12565 [Nitriliruptoraceae bacterium ZYF776]|nr:hypothetical protein [Profundirhabdus halotolerans]
MWRRPGSPAGTAEFPARAPTVRPPDPGHGPVRSTPGTAGGRSRVTSWSRPRRRRCLGSDVPRRVGGTPRPPGFDRARWAGPSMTRRVVLRPTKNVRTRAGARVGLVAALSFGMAATALPATVAAQEADPVEVTLLATNDFHGRLAPPSYTLRPEGADASVDVGGAAYLATHLANLRADNPNSLHVDAGDLVGATPVLSNLFLDEPTVEAMNLMGLDIQTVGNHEFDRGRDELIRRAEGGCVEDGCFDPERPFEGQDFTTLSTNVVDEDTGEALTSPYELIEVGGVTIGFLGVTTEDTPTVVNPAGIQGLEFLPEAEAVNAWVPTLEAEGADAIVVLMHEGGRQDGTYNECDDFRGAAANIIGELDDAVDVVVTGHTHQQYVCDLEDGPLVTQANEYGTMITEIDLTIVPGEGVVDRSATNHLVTRDVEPDPDVQALLDRYQELAGPSLAEVVAQSTVAIPRTTREAESVQGNLATDALRDQLDDIDFAFQNSGGLRAALTDDEDTEVVGPEPVDFADVTGDNVHREAIAELSGEGILVGKRDGSFGPRDSVTRAQVASVLARIVGIEGVSPTPPTFSDIAGSVHAANIEALAAEGIIAGYPDGTFRPSERIKRDQVAALIARWLDVDPVATGPFTDLGNTIFAGEINALAQAGVLQGRTATTFAPRSDLFRDQFASIASRARAEAGIEPLEPQERFNIRRQNVLEVWPFGNTAAIVEVDGETLAAMLANGVREIGGGRFIQVSGLRIEYSIDESVEPEDNGGFPRGVVENVEYWQHADHEDGTPVDLSADATYRVAMNDFMTTGGDGYPEVLDQVVSLGDPLEIVIEAYLAENSPVAPEIEGRIVEVDG